jgi:hypothetical protein
MKIFCTHDTKNIINVNPYNNDINGYATEVLLKKSITESVLIKQNRVTVAWLIELNEPVDQNSAIPRNTKEKNIGITPIRYLIKVEEALLRVFTTV